MANKCTCRIIRVGIQDWAVEYCPLHQAAPAMRDALEKLADFVELSGFHEATHGGLTRQYTAARAALAQARGETGG